MSTVPKIFCFVLMPFESDFEDIYKLGIKQSCTDAGAYCERVDEQIFDESILERIYNQIYKADIIIADMTNRNPNVFYEVGYAHALGKTTILLTKKSEDIPFDLKHYPHIVYNNKITQLKEELTTRIKWFIENDSKKNEINQRIDIDIYLGKDSLSNRNVEYYAEKDKIPALIFTLHNKSSKTFGPGDYRVGIITNENYRFLRMAGSKTTKLPDGKLIHMYPIIEDILYPNSYTSFKVLLQPKNLKYEEDQEIIIRIFTPNGPRDFYLMIRYKE